MLPHQQGTRPIDAIQSPNGSCSCICLTKTDSPASIWLVAEHRKHPETLAYGFWAHCAVSDEGTCLAQQRVQNDQNSARPRLKTSDDSYWVHLRHVLKKLQDALGTAPASLSSGLISEHWLMSCANTKQTATRVSQVVWCTIEALQAASHFLQLKTTANMSVYILHVCLHLTRKQLMMLEGLQSKPWSRTLPSIWIVHSGYFEFRAHEFAKERFAREISKGARLPLAPCCERMWFWKKNSQEARLPTKGRQPRPHDDLWRRQVNMMVVA